MSPAEHQRLTRWREQWNPLRSLTHRRALDLLDQAQRGEHAEVQWAFRLVERRFVPMMALIERRIGALLEMDWDVEEADTTVAGYDASLARQQATFLRGYYEQVLNLYEAIEHLALAQFRGFGLCEVMPSPEGTLLQPVDGWNVVQDGLHPRFRYNPRAGVTTYEALGPGADLPLDRMLLHTAPRPIHEVALMLFVRAGLAEKDWDAWCDIYGIPGGVVTGPPQVPEGKEAEYQAAAEEIAAGGSGYLPHGSDYTANGHPSGNAPYEQRLRWIREELVLAGTGGQLTMLASPTGIGQGASGEHADTFRSIARGDARRLSETFQRQLDRRLLARVFPGAPVLAYWKLCLEDEIDTGAVVDHAQKLRQAGYKVRLEQLSERTGYDLEDAPAAQAPSSQIVTKVDGGPTSQTVTSEEPQPEPEPTSEPGPEPIAANRAPAPAKKDAGRALADDLAPLRGRMAAILRKLADPAEDLAAVLEDGLAALDAAGPEVLASDALARELEAALQAAVIQGAARK